MKLQGALPLFLEKAKKGKIPYSILDLAMGGDKKRREKAKRQGSGKTNKQLAMEGAGQVAQASKVMKKGGKVGKSKNYKCSHNRLYPVKKRGK